MANENDDEPSFAETTGNAAEIYRHYGGTATDTYVFGQKRHENTLVSGIARHQGGAQGFFLNTPATEKKKNIFGF